MKDAKGHGSNSRGIASVRHKVKDPTWTGTVITHGSKSVVSGGQPKSSNKEAAGALASSLKSAPAPIHDSMSAARISEATGAMSRLRETFRAGTNRHGEYGRNVKDAFDRHASTYASLTGKKPPNIYD